MTNKAVADAMILALLKDESNVLTQLQQQSVDSLHAALIDSLKCYENIIAHEKRNLRVAVGDANLARILSCIASATIHFGEISVEECSKTYSAKDMSEAFDPTYESLKIIMIDSLDRFRDKVERTNAEIEMVGEKPVDIIADINNAIELVKMATPIRIYCFAHMVTACMAAIKRGDIPSVHLN